MEVFVLMGAIASEGDMLLGVYSSCEEATNAHGVYVRDKEQGFDHYYVSRRVVSAPADPSFDGDFYL